MEDLSEEKVRIILREARRYLRKKGLKEMELSEQQMKEILSRILDASLLADIDENN